MRTELKDILKTLHEMANDAEECVSLLQTSFIYYSLKPLDECRQKTEYFTRIEPRLTAEIAELARDNTEALHYVSVPGHLLRIGQSLEKLGGLIEKMTKENVLFSDKAIEEITYLFQRLIDLLRPTSDIILARNSILARYVDESEAGVMKRALEYATLHEERLVEGICAPLASSLFLNMLDEIKSIAWHAKQIAVKLTTSMAVEVH
ncbi:MAG: hypothetical protein M1497_15380 [Nitrospirae bacterium]|nr:hypothetical protein [Nitrospirota bacterium]